MKNISCKLERVFMKVGALLCMSVFLTSCYVGQTSYAGEDSVYYSDKIRKNNKKQKSYGYVYDQTINSSNNNENQDQSHVRIGKKYIDPTSNASDLLYDDETIIDKGSYSSNNVNRYSADANQSYAYSYNKDGWGEDGGTVVNNYYYGGYSPYYSYYWGAPYWGWRSYWSPYYGWNWGVSVGWGWGWSGWDYPSYWGPSWGWNYPGYWRPHHHYWDNGWCCSRYYANYGSRSAYLNSSRGSSYISRSYGNSRSRQIQDIQRQNSRNAILSGSRNNTISNSRINSGSTSNISRIHAGERNGAIIGGSRANSGSVIRGIRNNNITNSDGARSSGVIRGSRNGVGIQGGSRNQVDIENSGVVKESANTGTIRGSRNSTGIIGRSRNYESGSSRISSPNYQTPNSGSRESSRGSIIGGGSRGGFGGGSMGGSRSGSIGGRR
jgi:hypothetical protein